ncbi:MAG: IPT/TIG domain-containing protein [Anaerolineales bacterium]|nr:IPT/TIG domain-containing protein [Anaerolineales bacterium]
MNFLKKSLLGISVIAALLISTIPKPAFAADLYSVTPSTIVNDAERIITVSGSGFDNTAVVLLNGAALATTYLNDNTLTAVVPAGYASGGYTVSVMLTGGAANTPVPSTPSPVLLTITAPTTIPSPPSRPQLRVASSDVDEKNGIKSNKPFKFMVNFENIGSQIAYNTQATFSSADLAPLETGGVAMMGNANGSGGRVSAEQRFVSTEALYGKSIVVIEATLSYNDEKGNAYSDKFTFSVPVAGAGGGSGVSATATPTGVRSGQLLITSYTTDVDPLQPGSQFNLIATVQNLGNDKASRVTMIVGGGSSGSSDGTPQPGGVSGGGGEFTHFAPVSASNVQSLGDLPAGGMIRASQDLIVNVSTDPGAYPIKITFSYLNAKGDVVNDEQVITLLVYSLPNLEISFYRPPDAFSVGQPGALPIQVVNLGKRTAVLGMMTVSSAEGEIADGSSLVGSLDKGGYFTMDSMFTPSSAGSAQLKFVVEYVDDFNQKRTVEKTLDVNVEEGFIEPTPDPNFPNDPNGFPSSGDETFWQKTWRFILGLFGLDSAPPASSPDMQMPPTDPQQIPIPNEGGGKG